MHIKALCSTLFSINLYLKTLQIKMKISVMTSMILLLATSIWTAMASYIAVKTTSQKSPCRHTPIAGKFLLVHCFLLNCILINLNSKIFVPTGSVLTEVRNRLSLHESAISQRAALLLYAWFRYAMRELNHSIPRELSTWYHKFCRKCYVFSWINLRRC